MTCADAGLIKALFHELVRQCGGVEAVAVTLGVTPQRVSQLQSPNCTDLPALAQVLKLERWIGEAVVTGALAKLINSESRRGDLATESRQTIYAAADLSRRVEEGASIDELRTLAGRLQRELDDVNAALSARN